MQLARLPRLVTAVLMLALPVLTCTPGERLGPARPLEGDVVGSVMLSAVTLPDVRISELHYDNTSTDAGEAIEVSGPAGTDLTGWTIVLYNGAATVRAPYGTATLSGLIPATCESRGVVVVAIAGIQNGSPDGLALVNGGGAVVEFLSYEGTFTALSGAAAGMTSTDIGVTETESTPVGQSLQRNSADLWNGPSTHTFGACNDAALPPPPPPPPPLPPTRFSELHYDNVGTDAAEAIEIEGPSGTDLAGWSVVLYNGSNRMAYNTRVLSGTIADQCDGRGVRLFTYEQDGIQNGSPDGLALLNAAGAVVEFLSYEGTFTAVGGPADGLTSSDIGVAQSGVPFGQSLQRNATGVWSGSSGQSRGGCNSAGALPPPSTITFSGRLPFDAPLPVGFEDQLFGTLRDGIGTILLTTFTWTSESPALASIDSDGVMHALAAGTATYRATAAEGTTATFSLPMAVAVASTTAQYAGNVEFGEPADGDPSDDFLVRRLEYTASFSQTRGTPNWVSYNIDASHFGGEDRCDCFTFDPALPFASYTTADYTGAGEFHGYLIDRGHLARSFDRTAGSLDNARTFYFTNIVPQAADQNQGPWAALENVLGNRARNDNREVYVIAGVAGSKGSVKNEGKIIIPAFTWKVAVIMPRDLGLDDIEAAGDVEVIAVIMSNDPGIRNVDWRSYETSIDAVEALSGYDLLALLPDHIEVTLETPAVAALAQLAAAHGASAPKLRDAHAKLETALRELAKLPADLQAALGNIEDAVGELEAAAQDGFTGGGAVMDGLAGLAREFAAGAARDALLEGRSGSALTDALRYLSDGDALRAAGRFKDAVNKYKDALAKAESAR